MGQATHWAGAATEEVAPLISFTSDRAGLLMRERHSGTGWDDPEDKNRRKTFAVLLLLLLTAYGKSGRELSILPQFVAVQRMVIMQLLIKRKHLLRIITAVPTFKLPHPSIHRN